MQTLTIVHPDDFHLHLRDGAAMASIVPDSARRFRRAIIMPNLDPPVVTAAQATAYRQRILACLPAGCRFEPLMTLYLTAQTTADEIRQAKSSGHVYAVKHYPTGVTTHAGHGVTDLERVYPVLEAMIEQRLPLLVHGEVPDSDADIFDRERIFIERVLVPLQDRFPELRIVLEHISTSEAVEFVKSAPATVAATITPHHVMLNRNAMFAGGLQPHYFCRPVLKAERHRRAVLEAATSGHPRFFLGTDSAPHARSAKETACGSAGIYSAHNAIELFAELFEAAGFLDRLEAFGSFYGADFYGLPRNDDTLTLVREQWTVPLTLPFGDDVVVPLHAGRVCQWKLMP